jgi:hypothetical protein
MCFVLYVGTTNPLPRKKFDKNAPALSVESLTERDAGIKRHFHSPEVQYVGSTSCCGCDFPHAIFQNGDWPEIEFHKTEEKDKFGIATDKVHRQNCEALVSLLHSSGEHFVEVYGIWDGEFDVAPQVHEDISIESLQARDFYFKEKGFYRVHVSPQLKCR